MADKDDMTDGIIDDILKGSWKQKRHPQNSQPGADQPIRRPSRQAPPNVPAYEETSQQSRSDNSSSQISGDVPGRSSGMDELFEELGAGKNRSSSKDLSQSMPSAAPSNANSLSEMISDISWEIHSKSRKLAAADEFILNKPKLYQLNADEAIRYASAIEAITGARPRQANFEIDALGHESSIGELEDYCIFVSPKQLEADIIGGNYSFKRNILMKLMDSAGSLLEQISFGEALYGKLKTNFSELSLRQLLMNLDETKSKIFNLELSLDTASNAVSIVKELQSAYAKLGKDPDLIVKRGYLEELLERSRIPKSIHGPIDRIKVPDVFPVTSSEDFIKISRKDQDMYCFRDAARFMFIYFDPDNGKNGMVTERNCVVLNGSNTEELINTLFDMGLISYSFTRGKEKLELLKKKYSQAESTSDVLAKINGEGKIMPAEISDFYRILQELRQARDKRSYFLSLPTETKLDLAVPMRSDRVLYEIIDRSTQTRLMQAYAAGEPFIEIWKKGSASKREEMLKELMPQLMYEDQNNYAANAWLYENSRETCLAQGIRFRIEETE